MRKVRVFLYCASILNVSRAQLYGGSVTRLEPSTYEGTRGNCTQTMGGSCPDRLLATTNLFNKLSVTLFAAAIIYTKNVTSGVQSTNQKNSARSARSIVLLYPTQGRILLVGARGQY